MSPGARFAALLLPAATLAGLLFASRALATPETGGIQVCRHSGSDGKGSRKADLAKVDAAYSAVAKAFREGLKNLEKKHARIEDRGYDAGLKACARSEIRELAVTEPAPAALRGKRFHFLRVLPGGRLGSSVIRPSKDGLVFLLSFRSLEDAGFLAKALEVNVSAGSAELAARFGVRCADTVVEVSKDGRKVTLEETAP